MKLTILRTTQSVKRLLFRSGLRPSVKLELASALLELGQWLREHPSPRHFPGRYDLYRYVHGLLGRRPFDFLEFGVFQGESIRFWARLDRHPETMLFGFDTFTGFPEEWRTGLKKFPKGYFDVGGALPELGDARVRFFKGTFQETLPGFLRKYNPQAQVVVHCDADIYNSTLYALTRLADVLNPGTVLLFGDFSAANHDFRAFVSFVGAYDRAYEVLGTAEASFDHIAIRLL